MTRAAGQPGDQVGVHRAGHQRAVGQPGTDGRLVGGEPGQLRAGEVRVKAQPGQLAHPEFVTRLAQLCADPGGPPVLPDDGAPRRRQRRRIPDDCRLPLVGDAQGGDRLRILAAGNFHGGPIESLTAGGQRGLPDVLRQVLDPAGMGIVLAKLLVTAGGNGSVGAHHERSHSRCSSVNRKDTHGR